MSDFIRAEYEASLEANRFPVPKLDIYCAMQPRKCVSVSRDRIITSNRSGAIDCGIVIENRLKAEIVDFDDWQYGSENLPSCRLWAQSLDSAETPTQYNKKKRKRKKSLHKQSRESWVFIETDTAGQKMASPRCAARPAWPAWPGVVAGEGRERTWRDGGSERRVEASLPLSSSLLYMYVEI
jgi:hypothetical protein